jgi:MoaA/NifB/PqqE/SkfB family radical SAM enzyme
MDVAAPRLASIPAPASPRIRTPAPGPALARSDRVRSLLWPGWLRDAGAAVGPLLGARPGTPRVLSFLVTARCPLRCQHCFYHAGPGAPGPELSVDEYAALGRSLGPFTVGLFCGGEPYLRPDLGEIVIRLRREHGVPLASTTTNGQLTASIVEQTEAILRAEPRKPFTVGFSLDGPEEVHDAIRGRGAYARALTSLAECRRLRRAHAGLLLTVTLTLSTLNQRQAAGFLRWAAGALEPDALVVLHVRQSPRAGAAIKAVEPGRYREAQAAAQAGMRRGPIAASLGAVARHVERTRAAGARSFHCLAGVNGAVIDPLGRVQVCEALADEPLALRAHGMDFAALWRSPAAARARALVNHHPACRACTHETMGHAPSICFPPNLSRLLPW